MSKEKQTESGLPSFFSAVLNLRASIRYGLETLGNIDRTVTELKNIAEIRSNETFKNHLAQMGKSPQVDPVELSYSMGYASKSLSPQIDRNSPSKDFVACTVALGDDYRKAVQPCLDSHQLYCRARGYDYARLTVEPSRRHRHPSWYKIPLAYKLMQLGYKKIFL